MYDTQLADAEREIARLRAELEAVCKWPMHKKVEIRNRYYYSKRLTQKKLAAEFGCSVAFISKIIQQADEYMVANGWFK